ncbi:MAG: ribosome recycling factor [Candidatus Paceibacterota bacterium]|jgi:ribosome recycling factor
MAYDFNPLKKQLSGVDEWLKKEFSTIRTGMASPQILDGVRVEIYGAPMSIKELGSVMIEGARTLRVTPWDKSQVKSIEKAITVANLGVSVIVDDQGLRVIFPELTEDRRKDIVKVAKEKVEEGKKQIRQHREAVIRDLDSQEKTGGMGKDDVFRLKHETQKIVDEAVKKTDETFTRKEKEILG